MNGHLSPERIAAFAAGERNAEDLRHLEDCAVCAAETARLDATLAQFRDAVRGWSARQPASVRADVCSVPRRRSGLRTAWVAAAAGLAILIAFPAWRAAEQNRRAAQIEADNRLSQEVQMHLMREVPQPLEPLTKLVGWETPLESGNEISESIGEMQ